MLGSCLEHVMEWNDNSGMDYETCRVLNGRSSFILGEKRSFLFDKSFTNKLLHVKNVFTQECFHSECFLCSAQAHGQDTTLIPQNCTRCSQILWKLNAIISQRFDNDSLS